MGLEPWIITRGTETQQERRSVWCGIKSNCCSAPSLLRTAAQTQLVKDMSCVLGVCRRDAGAMHARADQRNSLPSTGVAVFAEVSARLTRSQLQQLVPLSLPLLLGVHQSRLHKRTEMEILISTCRCSPTQTSIIIHFHYFHLHLHPCEVWPFRIMQCICC